MTVIFNLCLAGCPSNSPFHVQVQGHSVNLTLGKHQTQVSLLIDRISGTYPQSVPRFEPWLSNRKALPLCRQLPCMLIKITELSVFQISSPFFRHTGRSDKLEITISTSGWLRKFEKYGKVKRCTCYNGTLKLSSLPTSSRCFAESRAFRKSRKRNLISSPFSSLEIGTLTG